MRPFVFGFTQELRKLAGEAVADLRAPLEGETWKGKGVSAGMPQKVTPKKQLPSPVSTLLAFPDRSE
jgi:hypothetical protein